MQWYKMIHNSKMIIPSRLDDDFKLLMMIPSSKIGLKLLMWLEMMDMMMIMILI
jgi:hypothetical protein